MKLFAPNISNKGRVVRALGSIPFLVGAVFTYSTSFWLALGLVALAAFVLFEALRGWCALRACGIKTRL